MEAEVAEINRNIAELSEAIAGNEQVQRNLVLEIPNLPQETVPVGGGCRRQSVPASSGVKSRKFGGKVLDHVALGEQCKLFDLERAAKLSGSGFICFTGAGARLERALINFMLELHTSEHGYMELGPPFLVRRDCMIGTGQLPKFESELYGLENGELFLAPTAEVPVTNFHREEILALSELPKKFVAYTPCFRREAGSAGRETRGLIRVHQFDKVELVKIATPEQSCRRTGVVDGRRGTGVATARAALSRNRVVHGRSRIPRGQNLRHRSLVAGPERLPRSLELLEL